MKKITVLIAALTLAWPVFAQQPAKPAAPAKDTKPAAPAQEPAKVEAPKPATMAEAPKAAAPKKHMPSRRTEDARQCLDKGGNNTEIIKCAEEYL